MRALEAEVAGRAAAFDLLGRGDEVRSHNDYRTLQREVGRLKNLAEALGEELETR